MDITIRPFCFNQSISVPASKSYLQRYIALASVCNDWSIIQNSNYCEDVLAALNAAQSMGASIQTSDKEIKIKGIRHIKKDECVTLDINESGLSARMFGIMAPVLFKKVILSGKGSILHRSMVSLIETLQQMKCNVISASGECLPLEITGYADFDTLDIESPDTSQIITGLLYASLLMNKDTSIICESIPSKPYIDISINVARQFGASIKHSADYKNFYIKHQPLHPVDVTAEGDWSNAAFFIVAAALSGCVKLSGLNAHSLQGDKIILNIVQKAGAKVYWDDETCIVEKNDLIPFEADLTNYPDLFPPLGILAAGIKGTSVLSGVSRLYNKESNRAEVLVKELANVGVDIKILRDKMIVNGKGYINGGVIDSHNDHRIAMMAAIAACIAKNNIIIKNAEAVNKSYPDFFNHLGI
ncbi:MAG: 3-phosphoshikimate 1-carboxyvinyltransferase [Bacteroidia bacterium]|nr:MAG: 3-phosphoshikimate 1-carboxyvinyltransferase [Bacteroidia bacterium]